MDVVVRDYSGRMSENGMILETTEQNTGSQNDTAYAEDAVVGSVTERDQEDTEAIIDTEAIKTQKL